MTRPHVEKEGSSRCAGCDHTFGQHDLSSLAAEAAKHGMPGPCLYGFGTWMRCECHGFRSEQPAAPSPREDWKRGAEEGRNAEIARLRQRINELRVRLDNVEPCVRGSKTHAERLGWWSYAEFLRSEITLTADTINMLPIPEPAPSRGAEADEAVAREWLASEDFADWYADRLAESLASFRAQARREAAAAMREAIAVSSARTTAAIRALPLPGAEREPDDPCYCCRQGCEPGCRCRPAEAEREVEAQECGAVASDGLGPCARNTGHADMHQTRDGRVYFAAPPSVSAALSPATQEQK